MPKQMTTRDFSLNNRRWWDKNEDALNWLIEEITRGKSEKKSEEIKNDLYDTHTYLLLCEAGALAPPETHLLRMYREEQKEGIYGFLKVFFEWRPDFMDD